MIYIIDDKRSRQCDYGWNEEKFSSFGGTIIPIWGIDDLFTYRDSIIEQNNVVLFHESFLSSTDEQKNTEIESLKSELRESISFLYVAYFSGSKNSRFVDGHICMLPPEVLYDNLEIFVSNYEKGVIDFKYLAFGENYNVEEKIRNRLSKIIDENIDGEIATIEKRILFAETKKDSIEHPFSSCDIARDWDYFPSDISDIELDGFVYKWLNEKKYDIIYIPLCFGNVFCDYLGLRLAMHIRLTLTANQNVPIFIYGVSSIRDIFNNECFDVLKLSGVYLINASNEVLIQSAKMEVKCLGIENEIDHIKINIPSNIGNNHSLANRWAIIRWQNMLQWKTDAPNIPTHNLYQSLYFKYLVSIHGKRNRFKENQKYPARIDGIEGKTILYIDDEYDKGWYNILRQIIEGESKAHFLCFDKFDKRMSKEKLISHICEFIENKDKDNDVNCYLLDLRLHEDDFSKESDLSGHVIADYIKNSYYVCKRKPVRA